MSIATLEKVLGYVRDIIENPSQTVPRLLLIRDLVKDEGGEDKVLLDAFNRCLLSASDPQTSKTLCYFEIVNSTSLAS